MPNEGEGTDPGKAAETRLAECFPKTIARGLFTDKHKPQLAGMSDELVQVDDQLMEDLLAFGRMLKRMQGTDPGRVAETTC